MRRDFLNRLIKKHFKQLIDSVRALRPHCHNFKVNDFKHYCAAVCAGTFQAHMWCTAAIDESMHQIWRNRFVYWVFTECWYRAVLCQLIDYFKRVESASLQPNVRPLIAINMQKCLSFVQIFAHVHLELIIMDSRILVSERSSERLQAFHEVSQSCNRAWVYMTVMTSLRNTYRDPESRREQQ